MRKRSDGDEVDCGDKRCFLVHQLRQLCIIDLPTNNSLCEIPCIMEGCVKETHRSIVCPLWICESLPTTSTTSTTVTTASTATSSTTVSTASTTVSTTSTTQTTATATTTSTMSSSTTSSIQTTTSVMPTTSPPQPVPFSCHSVGLYLSIGLNVLLIIGLIVLLFKYLKLKREDMEFEENVRRSLAPSAPRVDRYTGQVGPFSLGSLENLLPDNERQPLLQNQIRSAGFQTSVSAQSSVSDETFLRHRSEYMFMKTFKPEAAEQPRMNESRV
jgi:hypothetical protein